MAIIHGSLLYDASGRKKKKFKPSQKTKAKKFKPAFWARQEHEFKPVSWSRQATEYKSATFKPLRTKKVEDTSYRQEISKQYTIAPAYNKGAYQVIPESDIKNIGR